MPFLSARDRHIEMVFLALWAMLLVWALVDRLGAGTHEPWENGSLLLAMSMVIGSASQFVSADRVRWSMRGISLVIIAIALFMIFP